MFQNQSGVPTAPAALQSGRAETRTRSTGSGDQPLSVNELSRMPAGRLELPKASRAAWVTARSNCRYATPAEQTEFSCQTTKGAKQSPFYSVGAAITSAVAQPKSTRARYRSRYSTRCRSGPLLLSLYRTCFEILGAGESAPAGSNLAPQVIGEPVFGRFRAAYGIHAAERGCA